MSTSRKLSPSWREVATSNGFGILCVHYPEGERFTFILTDATKVREHGFRAVETLLSEHELRAQLAQAGFSEDKIDIGIQVARTWATTMTRRHRPGPIG